ncbi:NAD(P)/FAD-dependent oxidoreductase [Peribacillus frigoritolerans]|uniref:NAD(P)/FAD-dependent oxidoreductase n=1 Tax=Peribacillus TaxID=2675229 RepID=UPI002E1DC18C|nr:NAD(P)/FAD-dependent oxidoreductase [Peribacillus frigoritolerans]
MSEIYDVIVIGGGPAGSSISTLLSNWGRKVLLLEKEKFPREHIGESLLPANWKVFDKLGVSERIRSTSFVPKPGGTFIWGKDRNPWTVYFGEVNGLPAARQVKRDIFDKILLDNAKEKGVKVKEQSIVKEVIFEDNRATGVVYENGKQTCEAKAKYVVDASGQDKLLGKKLKSVEYNPDFKNIAVWSYWENGKQLEGHDKGNVIYITFEHGWFWYIPLDFDNNLISVGAIVRPEGRKELKEKGFEKFYLDAIKSSDQLPQLLKDAKQVADVKVIKDYSYRNKQLFGEGWLMVGDAACFVDPILSSGVMLATSNGMMGAYALNMILDDPNIEKDILKRYEDMYIRNYNTFTELCNNMYDTQKKSKEDYFSGARNLVQPKLAHEKVDETGDRQAFISLISGLNQKDTEKVINNFLEKRKKIGDNRTTFNEETMFMVFDHINQNLRNQKSKNEIINSETLIELNSKVEIKNEYFVPVVPNANKMNQQRVLKNQFGDIIQISPLLELLVDSLRVDKLNVSELKMILSEKLQNEIKEKELIKWLKLCHNYGLIELNNQVLGVTNV